MKHIGQKRRQWTVALLAMLTATITAAAPFVLNVGDVDWNWELEPADVIAGGRDSHTIARPLVLHSKLGLSASAGQVSVVAPKGVELSGQQSKLLLERGLADLRLHRGELSFGAAAIGVPTAEAAIGSSATPDAMSNAPPIAMALSNGRFATLRLTRSTLTIAMPHGGNERLTNVHGAFNKVGKHAISGKGTALWRGQRIAFTLQSAGAANGGAGAVPLELNVKGLLVSLSFRGQISGAHKPQLQGHMSVSSSAIRRLARSFGATWPDGTGLGQVLISGAMNWTGDLLAFSQAKVDIDGNKGVGALTLSTSGAKPLATGTIAFDDFDLTPLLAGSSPSRPAQFGSGAWLSQLRGVWSMPVARLLDADVRLSVKHVRLGKTTIGRLASTIAMKNGTLLANVANLTHEDGNGSGLFEIDFNGLVPRMTFRGKLTNAPIGQLSQALFGKRYLDGQATLTADIVAHGQTLRQMVSGVSGVVEASMPAGCRAAIDLQAFDSGGTSPPSATTRSPTDKLFNDARKGMTRLSSLKATMLLAGGRLIARDVTGTYAGRTVKLIGRADLTTQTLDMRMLIVEAPTTPTSTQDTASTTLGGSLTTLRGNWQTPKIGVSSHKGRRAELEELLRRPLGQSEHSRM